MGEVKVSVIIPIYNAEKYLERSIRSILDQTLKEFELILINDGSEDGSGEICERFSEGDDRITIVHKKNKGLSNTRNAGIRLARGDYIQFVDADDYVDENMLEEQYNLAVDTGAQVTMCGMKYDIHLKDGKVITDESGYRDMIITNQEDIKPIFMELFNNFLFNYATNKLYKRSFLIENMLEFVEWLSLDEDTNFNIDVFERLERLTITSRSYYHYVKPFRETMVSRYHKDKFKIMTFSYNRLKKLLKEWGIYEENKKKVASIYSHHVVECFELYTHRECQLTIREKLKEIRKIMDSQDVGEELVNIEKLNSFFSNVVYQAMKRESVVLIYALCVLKKGVKELNIKTPF